MSLDRYFYIKRANSDKIEGPYELEELQNLDLSYDDSVWTAGWDTWKKVREDNELVLVCFKQNSDVFSSPISKNFDKNLTTNIDEKLPHDVKQNLVNNNKPIKKSKRIKLVFILITLITITTFFIITFVSSNANESKESDEIMDDSGSKRTQKSKRKDPNQIRLEQFTQAIKDSDPEVKALADELASRYEGSFNFYQVCYIYDYMVRKWKYVSDPYQKEMFKTPSYIIKYGLKGDCDDFSILLASLIYNIGGEIRISTAQCANEGHAFVEVLAGSSYNELENAYNQIKDYYWDRDWTCINEVNYSTDNFGRYWINLDWQTSRSCWGRNIKHVGGPYCNYTRRIIYYPLEDYYETDEQIKL